MFQVLMQSALSMYKQ